MLTTYFQNPALWAAIQHLAETSASEVGSYAWIGADTYLLNMEAGSSPTIFHIQNTHHEAISRLQEIRERLIEDLTPVVPELIAGGLAVSSINMSRSEDTKTHTLTILIDMGGNHPHLVIRVSESELSAQIILNNHGVTIEKSNPVQTMQYLHNPLLAIHENHRSAWKKIIEFMRLEAKLSIRNTTTRAFKIDLVPINSAACSELRKAVAA